MLPSFKSVCEASSNGDVASVEASRDFIPRSEEADEGSRMSWNPISLLGVAPVRSPLPSVITLKEETGFVERKFL